MPPYLACRCALALIVHGQGGAIYVWVDRRDGFTFRAYAQRVSAAGDVQWSTDRVPVSTTRWNRGGIPAWDAMQTLAAHTTD